IVSQSSQVEIRKQNGPRPCAGSGAVWAGGLHDLDDRFAVFPDMPGHAQVHTEAVAGHAHYLGRFVELDEHDDRVEVDRVEPRVRGDGADMLAAVDVAEPD